MRRPEPMVECVMCGAIVTWRHARRGALPFAEQRVWLCRHCFFAYGCNRRSLKGA